MTIRYLQELGVIEFRVLPKSKNQDKVVMFTGLRGVQRHVKLRI